MQSRLVKGPFNVKWGDNTLVDVEAIDLSHDIDDDDYKTLGGKTITLDGSYKVTAKLTLLASDIPALSAVFPQYFVPNGGVLSTGETVNNADGAIDIKAASCDEATVYNNLDIISCGNPANVLRLVNTRTRIDGVDIDSKVQKVDVMFIGESDADEATMQMFINGTIHTVS